MSAKEYVIVAVLGGAACLGVLSVYTHRRLAPHGEAGVVVLDKVDSVEADDAPPAPPNPLQETPPRVAPASEVLPLPEPARIAVSVVGAVEAPGVYEFSESARVQDLIEAAHGAREDADLSDINLAARLIDGTTLTVPERPPALPDGRTAVLRRRVPVVPPNPPQYTVSGWRPAAPAAPAAGDRAGMPDPGASQGLIDLNHASAQELESLPGIGPKLAAEIIRYRSQTPFLSVDDAANVPGIAEKRLAAIRPFVTVGGR